MPGIPDISIVVTGDGGITGYSSCLYRYSGAKPTFILMVTFLEVGFYIYYHLTLASLSKSSSSGPVSPDSAFIYRPDKRSEIWRYIMYMFIHAEWRHLTFNVVLQLIIGIPLELTHGFVRIATIYLSGVLAGSLATSVFDRESLLVGSSSGVYALIAAHLANILMNFSEIEFAKLKLAAVCIVAIADFSLTFLDRFRLLDSPGHYPTGTAAHVTGAFIGLTTALICLKNSLHHKPRCKLLWWVAFVFYSFSFTSAIIWNITDYKFSKTYKFLR